MTLFHEIERSAADIASAEAMYVSQRTELTLIIFTIEEVSGSAADLLATLEANLIESHAVHRELMEEAMREPFEDARPSP